jgi:hypothetical protein
MKECIACAEDIKENAKLCRFCGTSQETQEATSTVMPQEGEAGRSRSLLKREGAARVSEIEAQFEGQGATVEFWADNGYMDGSDAFSFIDRQKNLSAQLRYSDPSILSEIAWCVFYSETSLSSGPKCVIYVTPKHIVLSQKSGREYLVFQQEEIDYIGLSDAYSTFSGPFSSGQTDYTAFHFVLKNGYQYKRYVRMGDKESELNEAYKKLNAQIQLMLLWYDFMELGTSETQSSSVSTGIGFIQGLD